jgi:sodium transport system permease protein
MSALWTIFRKELLDAFRDRRIVLVAFVIMPLAIPLVFAGMSTVGARKQVQQLEGRLDLPVVGAEVAPNLVRWLGSQNVRVIDPPADVDAAVRSQEFAVILRIDPRYADVWRAGRPAGVEIVYDSSRPLDTGTTVARVQGLLERYGSTVGTLRLVARGINPSVASPLQVGARDVSTPGSRFDLSQQLLPYLLLLLAFIGGMQLAIDATAGERERQSLEPLLATPVSRETIISAKILATAAFALASIAVTLIAYRVAFAIVPSGGLDTSFEVGPAGLLQLFVIILPVVLLGSTLLTALAAFARSYREAQGYLPLLMFLPMIPSLLLMVSPVRTQLWMLAVPMLSQNQLILRVLRGEPITAAEWAVSIGSGLLVAAVVWVVAARLYHREQLATSS